MIEGGLLAVSLIALGISGLAFYYAHLQGPKVEIYLKRQENQKSDAFSYEIIKDDDQHARLRGHVNVMLVNEGNRTSTIVPHESTGQEYNNFIIKKAPGTEFLRIAIARYEDVEEDIKMVLSPGENTVFRLTIEGANAGRMHHDEADQLLGKEVKAEFSFIATKRGGFETKKKEFKLVAIDKREKH